MVKSISFFAFRQQSITAKYKQFFTKATMTVNYKKRKTYELCVEKRGKPQYMYMYSYL